MTDAFLRTATLVRVIDGDTYVMDIDLGYRVFGCFHIRLRGYNAPELPTPEGMAARAQAMNVLMEAKTIVVQSYKDQLSFARWVADIYVDGVSLAERLTKLDSDT